MVLWDDRGSSVEGIVMIKELRDDEEYVAIKL